MRLLRLGSDGELSLTEDLLHDIPAYAILSHTWGSNNNEVTFQDIIAKRGQEKSGYQKILFCGEQAKRDGLDYFWVDTCCVDKTSSAELTESINSMYRWYKEAQKCYVHLADVKHGGSRPNEPTQSTWKSEFRKSRWFSRGWTLQELLAPRDVQFFDYRWCRLGTKVQLGQIISDITCIPTAVLAGQDSIDKYSIAQRMSWAAQRVTTRPEDRAYSVLGIFDISMPLLYGEGEERAFCRLQEEIIKRTDDQSIFAWQLPFRYSTSGLLAPTLAAFSHAQHIVSCHNKGSTTPFGLTNQGLRIETPIMKHLHNGLYGTALNCMDQSTGARLGVYLKKVGPDQFLRTRLDLLPKFNIDLWAKSFKPPTTKTIYIPQTSPMSYHPPSRLRIQRVLATHRAGGSHSCPLMRNMKFIATTYGICRSCSARTNFRFGHYLRRHPLPPS